MLKDLVHTSAGVHAEVHTSATSEEVLLPLHQSGPGLASASPCGRIPASTSAWATSWYFWRHLPGCPQPERKLELQDARLWCGCPGPSWPLSQHPGQQFPEPARWRWRWELRQLARRVNSPLSCARGFVCGRSDTEKRSKPTMVRPQTASVPFCVSTRLPDTRNSASSPPQSPGYPEGLIGMHVLLTKCVCADERLRFAWSAWKQPPALGVAAVAADAPANEGAA